MLAYFGYGTNRDIDMMTAMLGRDGVTGIVATAANFELVIQNLEHIPNEVLSTAPIVKSPREIMASALGDKAKLYIIRPKNGAMTHGKVWYITPEEYEMVRDWELLDFGMQEDMKIEVELESGETIIAQTHGSTDPNLPMAITVSGDAYEDYIVSKEKILETSRRVHKEFLQRTQAN